MASPWTLEQIDKLEQSGQLSPETAKAARSKIVPLSSEQQSSVANYIKSDPIQQQTDQLLQANTNDPFLRSMHGEGDFRDTGRKSDGLGESIDSVLGVPARVLANEIVQGKATPESFAKAVQSVGTDPRNAPTGHDVALNAGVSDKPMFKAKGSTLANIASFIPGVGHIVNAAKNFMSKEVADREFEPSPADVLGTAIDFTAQVPVATMGKAASGVAGVIRKIDKPLLHGTPHAFPLSEMKPSRGGHVGPGVYMTHDENTAANFGENVIKAKQKNTQVLDLFENNDDMMLAAKELGISDELASIKGADTRDGQGRFYALQDALIKKIDPEYKLIGNERAQALQDALREKGYTGVRYDWNGEPTYNIFDPKNLEEVAAKTGIASIDDFNTIAKTEQAKKVSKAGTLAQEGYTFGRKMHDNGGVEITAKWRGKEVGKAVITKTGVSHTEVNPLHKGKGIDEELLNFGKTDLFAGKAGAANAEDLGKASKADSILSKIDTPEKAAALNGAEREEYLKALDEAYGPREQRAKDLGFGDETYYHGTENSFDEFDLNRRGYNSGAVGEEAVFMSSNPEIASDYAGYANTMREADNLRDGQNVMPLRVKGKTHEVSHIDHYDSDEVRHALRDPHKYKDNILFSEMADNVNREMRDGSTMAVQDTKNIRSTNAAFDPRFKDSSNLLAGKSGVAGDAKDLSRASRIEASTKGKVPYKVSHKDGNLVLKSDVADASLDLRDMDTVESLDPEMVPFLEKSKGTVGYVADLYADKGYGGKALTALEQSAKKRGADHIYLNASPLGGTRDLSQHEAAEKLREFYSKHGYQVAEDYGTNTMMYKKLKAEAGFKPWEIPGSAQTRELSEDEENDFLDEAASIGNDTDLENYLNHILNQRGQ